MPSIKCTKKLADRAGFKLQATIQNTPNDWHANLFRFDRRSYVIFCSDLSRLTCLAGPAVKADLQDLPGLLFDALTRTLASEDFSDTAIRYAISKLEPLHLAKSDSRSILGTISDNLWHVDIHAYDAGGMEMIGLEQLSMRVNHMPLKPLNWGFAIDAFRKSVIHTAA